MVIEATYSDADPSYLLSCSPCIQTIDPNEPDEVVTLTLDQIEVKSYVGGLVRSFEGRAARPDTMSSREIT